MDGRSLGCRGDVRARWRRASLPGSRCGKLTQLHVSPRSDGRIYGRGTQDMKCVGIQYLLAVQRLMARGFKPRRTVYLLFVPDEEAGGVKGMQPFAEHPKVAELNAGVVLDEGLASTTDSYKVGFGVIW